MNWFYDRDETPRNPEHTEAVRKEMKTWSTEKLRRFVAREEAKAIARPVVVAMELHRRGDEKMAMESMGLFVDRLAEALFKRDAYTPSATPSSLWQDIRRIFT